MFAFDKARLTMQKQAAGKIDHQIGKTDAPMRRRNRNSTPIKAAFNLINQSTANPAPAVSTS